MENERKEREIRETKAREEATRERDRNIVKIREAERNAENAARNEITREQLSHIGDPDEDERRRRSEALRRERIEEAKTLTSQSSMKNARAIFEQNSSAGQMNSLRSGQKAAAPSRPVEVKRDGKVPNTYNSTVRSIFESNSNSSSAAATNNTFSINQSQPSHDNQAQRNQVSSVKRDGSIPNSYNSTVRAMFENNNANNQPERINSGSQRGAVTSNYSGSGIKSSARNDTPNSQQVVNSRVAEVAPQPIQKQPEEPLQPIQPIQQIATIKQQEPKRVETVTATPVIAQTQPIVKEEPKKALIPEAANNLINGKANHVNEVTNSNRINQETNDNIAANGQQYFTRNLLQDAYVESEPLEDIAEEDHTWDGKLILSAPF